MEFLKNKILIFLLWLCPLTSFGQGYSYSFIDPCTLNQQTLFIPQGSNSIVLNYFGDVQTFSTNDFTNGVFDNWLNNVTQINSSSPCQSVTQVIISNSNNIVTSTNLMVVANIISSLGGGMLPPAESINNSTSSSEDSEEDEQNNNNDGNNTNQSGSTGNTQTNSNNQETQGNQSTSQTSGGNNSETTGGSGGSNSVSKNGERTTEQSVEESSGSQSLANSIANATDGGSSSDDGGNKGRSGSLIASGDIVVISNTPSSSITGTNLKIVGSITHANTEQTRIQGALFDYTTGVNNLNLTFYKSWINPKRTFNTVAANSIMMDFDKNVFNTVTGLQNFRFLKKYTGMFGLNLTYGKLGKRELLNLSSVIGAHGNFKINDRISTNLLLLGVYSPFTQFYEGKWWDAGLLVVPFNSWDIKITKTFKYNISFTGVYQFNDNFINYQILTGGKLNF